MTARTIDDVRETAESITHRQNSMLDLDGL